MIFSQHIEKYVAAKVLPPVEGKITFAEVSFGYLGIDILFSALNLEIQPGADTADIVKASKAAHTYEFISLLPASFDTIID